MGFFYLVIPKPASINQNRHSLFYEIKVHM